MGDRRGVFRDIAGKPEGKRPLGRSRRRWEDNTNVDLHEVESRAWAESSCLRIVTGDKHL